MKTITLLNSKGGTGKTTLATHLAAGLSLFGQRVLLIDADGQGNATTALGLAKSPAFYDLVVRGAEWRESIRPVDPDIFTPPGAAYEGGALYCVPGNVETRNIPNTISDETVLARRVRELETLVDFVIFDTSPTASLLHSAIHAATDYLLLPTQLEGHSALEGLPETLERANAIRERAAQYGLDLCRVLGVVPNMFRAGTVTHESVLDHLKNEYGELVWEAVRQRIVVSEANLSKQLVYAYAPDSPAADELMLVAEAVLNTVGTAHEQA